MRGNKAGGEYVWYIPDCYYPEITTPGHYVSHEAICVLNTGLEDAEIKLTLYFEDRDPIDDFIVMCPARRTRHIRLDQIKDGNGNGIPKGIPYAIMLKSSCPIVVQYSRLDTTQAEIGLATTIAYPMRQI